LSVVSNWLAVYYILVLVPEDRRIAYGDSLCLLPAGVVYREPHVGFFNIPEQLLEYWMFLCVVNVEVIYHLIVKKYIVVGYTAIALNIIIGNRIQWWI